MPELVSVIPNTIATKIPLKFPKVDRAGRLIELVSGDPKHAETLITPKE